MKKSIYWIIFIILLFVGGIYLVTKNQNSIPDSALAEVKPEEVEITPQNYDIGKVIMKSGFVTREYELKNNSDNVLRLKKITTSCMCTKAQIVSGDEKTRFYAMEMGGANNPVINFDIPAKSGAKIVVRFDPAAHGIEGVGAIDRRVYLTFMDPVGTREVSFFGEVVLK